MKPLKEIIKDIILTEEEAPYKIGQSVILELPPNNRGYTFSGKILSKPIKVRDTMYKVEIVIESDKLKKLG